MSSKDELTRSAQLQELHDQLEFLKLARTTYQTNRHILNNIEQCLDEQTNRLDGKLKRKVRRIINSQEIMQLQLDDDYLLGVTPSDLRLTPSEGEKLFECVKSGSFVSEHSESDERLVKCLDEYSKECEIYHKHQMELLQILEQLKDIKINAVPKDVDKKLASFEWQSKINSLKAKVAKEKHRIDVFMETNQSLSAYEQFIKDLKQQIQELKEEIVGLEELKRKYSEVACKEYDDLLKSYLHYKLALDKKKMMQELCQ